MSYRRAWFGTVILAGIVVCALSGVASAQSRCSGSKIKATAKKQACIAMAYAHAAQSMDDPKVSDIQECELKFSTTFSKLEAKGDCPTTGDAATIEEKVNSFVDDLVFELDNGENSRCQALKIRAAASKAKCLLYLEAKEAAKAVPKDPVKVQRCRDRLTRRFAALELGPGCETTGDANAIEAKVDAFVADVDQEIPGATTTTSTTTSTLLPI